jgi:cytochrome c553
MGMSRCRRVGNWVRRSLSFFLFPFVFFVCFVVSSSAAQPGAELFEARVRPVLVDKCYRCHGPQKQMSGLRLDSREALLKGGDNGPVLRPGDPDGSSLIQAVRHQGDRKMPPKEKLPDDALGALVEWVRKGAPWPEGRVGPADSIASAARRHWAFQPVQKPLLPAVKDTAWPQTSIDRFLLARLEEKGLTPSPRADRRTLLRRVTCDLIGLPPAPEEVAAFEADPSPDAFAKVVDRLLASPHYGERWGRYWLDVARYADTKGYVFFEEAPYPWAYTYRDYVIRAFNEDLPYDRFLLEQLAADRLPLDSDRRPLTALGFLTVGGRFMSNQHDIIDDRIDVVTRGLLGLTVTCARCHEHKYDPIPQQDYYALYGVFASCAEPTVPPLFAEPPATKEYAAFAKEMQARERKLAEFVAAKHAELVNAAKARVAEYVLAVHAARNQPNTEEFMLLADGGDLNPTMIFRYRGYLERTQKTHHPVWALWHALADLPETDFPAKAAALGVEFAARSEPSRPLNPLVVGAFAARPPKTLTEAAQRYGDLLNGVERLWQERLREAVQARRSAPAALSDPALEELRQVFHGAEAPANVALLPYGDLSLLPDRASQAKLQELRKAVEQWRATGPAAPPRAMVLEDLPVPYQPHVFRRGNPNNPGEAVPRRFLQVLSGARAEPFRDGSGRRELARAIASRDNPLTARVLVNRIWLHHFGAGLVRTPSDFGLRSEPPSHPELLDHLATAFMDSGWSIKKLHRLILLSAAYQQRSDDRAECRRVDPENALLWRMNRRRLDFEATRDALLAAAGHLDRRVGGPSVQDLASAGATRRTLYGYLDRLNVPGLYRTFDFPSPDATNPQRDLTTVAPQALFLMNHPFSIECARRLLRREDVVSEKDHAAKITRIYRILYGRIPKPEELQLAREFLGTSGASETAWERYAQALLMANELVFVD